MVFLVVGFLAGFLAGGFFAVGLLATTFLEVSFLAADFLLAGLPVAVLALLLSFGPIAVFALVFVFWVVLDWVLACLEAFALLASFMGLAALATARDFPAVAFLPLTGRLVASFLAATSFPADLPTAFLPAGMRARPTGGLFLVVDFLGLKGCHPVSIGGIDGMVGKTAKCVKLTIISLSKKRNSLL